MNRLLLTLPLLNPLIVSCAASHLETPPITDSVPYQVLANQKLHSNIHYRFNEDRSLVLCISQAKPTPQIIHPPLRFFIYDVAAEKVVFEDSLANGEVKWLDSHRIAVRTIPGIVRVEELAGQVSGYIFDTKTGKKVKQSGARQR